MVVMLGIVDICTPVRSSRNDYVGRVETYLENISNTVS